MWCPDDSCTPCCRPATRSITGQSPGHCGRLQESAGPCDAVLHEGSIPIPPCFTKGPSDLQLVASRTTTDSAHGPQAGLVAVGPVQVF